LYIILQEGFICTIFHDHAILSLDGRKLADEGKFLPDYIIKNVRLMDVNVYTNRSFYIEDHT